VTTASGSSRRRRAEHARVSSDLTRRRGWVLAAALGTVSVLLVLLAHDGPRSLVSPGPLARPHAGIACAGCHLEARTAAASCTTCHGGHPSARAAHRALAAGGDLPCTSCHGAHQEETGVAFDSSGSVSIYRGGVERVMADASRGPGGLRTPAAFVPLVPRARCTRCHDTENQHDGAAACLAGATSFALCFDEHRRVATSAAVPAARDALVERARAVARSPSSARLGGVSATTALAVALGVGIAGLAVGFARRRRRTTYPSMPAAVRSSAARRLPVIDAARCLGCHACVDACPYDALVLRRYVAVLARPDACCGAGPCQTACPNGSLELLASAAEAPGPRLSAELQAVELPGVFLAGDVTGGSLVRNALRQGVTAARAASELVFRHGKERPGASEHDLVVVGAGPAGLAAALTAKALGLRVIVLEQSRLAASIVSFSRGKLVLDAPSGDEERLPLFVGDVPKEELVLRWQRTVRAAHLDIVEGARVVDMAFDLRSGFSVRAELPSGSPRTVAARAVILAVGTRGTPRELDACVAPEASAHVHYELSDARAFAGRRAVVVGLGDVAMETALALAAQPATEVTILQRGSGFRRGKQRNIDALAALVARGRVRLIFEARVERVSATRLEVTVAGKRCDFEFDALFVHVGRVPGHELLARTGVCPPARARLAVDPWDSAQHDRPSSSRGRPVF
jgi:thioredoxin reductase/ferredoxin